MLYRCPECLNDNCFETLLGNLEDKDTSLVVSTLLLQENKAPLDGSSATSSGEALILQQEKENN
jgi:hypothetical protein